MNNSLDHCRSYIESQFQSPPCHPFESGPFVTISRQAGAGGITIARLLSDRLRDRDARAECGAGWPVFDAALVDQVIEDHGLSAGLAQHLNEDSSSEIEEIMQDLFSLGPQKATLVQKTSETLLRLARLGRVILVGRAAPVVTARLEGGLHIRLVASVRKRIEHLKDYFGFDTMEAAEYVRTEDGGRKRYLKKYFNQDIDNPLLYDLVINTDEVPYEHAAGIIAYAVKRTAGAACL